MWALAQFAKLSRRKKEIREKNFAISAKCKTVLTFDEHWQRETEDDERRTMSDWDQHQQPIDNHSVTTDDKSKSSWRLLHFSRHFSAAL